jgi:large conductance mechanosensitive channel
MFKEFRDFINRGNVLDLAVAVIIGAAFGKIVTSLTDDILMPIIGKIFGGLDFSSYFVAMGPVPANLAGSTDYVALKKAGVPLFGYGAFITQAVNFLIVAFIVFMIVRTVSKAIAFEKARFEREEAVKVETKPAPDAPDVALLREILAELRQGRAAPREPFQS